MGWLAQIWVPGAEAGEAVAS